MEEAHSSTPPIAPPKEAWHPPFTCVTPLSKALAVALFILLPFVGFVVGVGWGEQYSVQPRAVQYPIEGSSPEQVTIKDRIKVSLPERQQSGEVTYVNEQYGYRFSAPALYKRSEHANIDPDTVRIADHGIFWSQPDEVSRMFIDVRLLGIFEEPVEQVAARVSMHTYERYNLNDYPALRSPVGTYGNMSYFSVLTKNKNGVTVVIRFDTSDMAGKQADIEKVLSSFIFRDTILPDKRVRVHGTVREVTGNCQPTVVGESSSCRTEHVSRIVSVFKLITENQLTTTDPILIATTQSDEDGGYSMDHTQNLWRTTYDSVAY